MPSSFQSINDLFKPGTQGASTVKGSAKPSTNDTSAEERFSQKMKEIDLKAKEQAVAAKAAMLRLPYIDLSVFPVTAEALRVIPEEQARAVRAVCFFATSDQIRVAALDKTTEINELVFQIAERQHAEVKLYLISDHSLERVFKLYASLPVVKPVTKDINITDEELEKFKVGIDNLQTLQQYFKDVSISDILTLIIASALKVNSSDIHIEAEEGGIAVRYRIDGVLHDVAMFFRERWKQFVSRIKLLAALKINVIDTPQDGRVTLKLSSGSLDVRVSTIPTTWGESVVMRILHSGNKGVTFDGLGLRGLAQERLRREIMRPNGMVITTGPTGSGKTTTMYAVLRTLNKPGVKIITLEDPVEIKMDGINQSQIDMSKGYSFAKGLKSILRQDPDICMVGEIRDLETADTAIQMALTGHLMLSTIHTNSAAGAIPRFLSMGVKSFLLAPALNSVIGQRLVRRICEKCKESYEPAPDVVERVHKVLDQLPPAEKNTLSTGKFQFYHGKGCSVCSGLGFKGRIGIYELLVMTKEIEQLILGNQVSETEIQDLAVRDGMVTMVQDGLMKALEGITTPEEVFRVTE
jgi:type II secretory ATPase GspE/PulE/Tfp pilus assembly ATPase PilB-like protein